MGEFFPFRGPPKPESWWRQKLPPRGHLTPRCAGLRRRQKDPAFTLPTLFPPRGFVFLLQGAGGSHHTAEGGP